MGHFDDDHGHMGHDVSQTSYVIDGHEMSWDEIPDQLKGILTKGGHHDLGHGDVHGDVHGHGFHHSYQ